MDGARLVMEELGEFITGQRRAADTERVLAAVMFLDIVDSTAVAAALGDEVWSHKLSQFQNQVRGQLQRYGGTELDTAGDGFLTSFPSPRPAIACAQAVAEVIVDLGLRLRTGVHFGECERIGAKLGGMSVHIGARLAALADPGEILVSATVRDILIGASLDFESRGRHSLKGVPGDWTVFAVAG